LEKDFSYSVLGTCATDGLCATACPVSINTGELVEHFRRTRQTASAQQWAARNANHFAATESLLRCSLRLGHAVHALIRANAVRSSSRLIKSLFGDNAPEWMPDTPHAAGPVPSTSRAGAQAV
jgi:D-lactate dehydrogenase